MRTFRLDRTFDAVLMDDAIAHMNSRADFAAALRAAHSHLNPGGVLVVTPDVTIERFQQNKTTTTAAARDGLDVVFIENVYDPNPADEQYETTIVYLIRDHGSQRIATDHWTMGIFSMDTWRGVLAETGFRVHEGPYRQGEDEYTVLACVKASI
jgi:SAM-dependent methyltransferase